jgi:cis-3-alkyl-4-acyloxetan-2-one decarboxylase
VTVRPYASQYPFTGRNLAIQGFRLHYLDEGSGDPVVMLHGNPTWSFYYRNLVLALRGDYRTIVPDHIGCGFSEKPDAALYPYTLERRVADLDELLERVGVRGNVTLVLHDWGGMIGMAWAHRRPEQVKRLVVLNTAAFHLPAGKRLPWPLRLCRAPVIGPLLVRGLNVFSRAAARWCVTRPMPKEVRAGYLAPYDTWRNRVAVLRFVQDIPLRPGDRGYDLVSAVQEDLHNFRSLPMLICWGEKDFVFDRRFLDEWRRRFPDAEVHAFADAGHFVLEDAGGEVIPLVRDFLKRHPLS